MLRSESGSFDPVAVNVAVSRIAAVRRLWLSIRASVAVSRGCHWRMGSGLSRAVRGLGPAGRPSWGHPRLSALHGLGSSQGTAWGRAGRAACMGSALTGVVHGVGGGVARLRLPVGPRVGAGQASHMA